MTLCLSSHAFGQGTDTGTLAGVTQDSNGAILPGVNVTVANTNTGLTRTITSNEEGRWVAPVLPLGTYTVKFELQGFQTLTRENVEVAATVTTTVDQQLGVEGVSDAVVIEGGTTPLLSPETATQSRQITSEELEAVPSTTRSFTHQLLTDTASSADLPASLTNSTGNVSPAINGTRTTSSSLLFNGIDATNFSSEGSLTENISPAPETIAEVKVLTSLYDASVGRSGGGNIQLVTKQGGNEVHGSAYYFVQNEIFNANDFFYNRDGIDRQKARRHEGGFVIGGPLVKDKFFYFGGYQRTNSDTAYVPTAQSFVVLPEALGLIRGPRTAANLLAAFRTFVPQFNVTPVANQVPDYIVRLFNLRNPETGDFLIPAPRPDAERLFTTYAVINGTATVTGRLTDRIFRNYPFIGGTPLVRQRNVVPARFTQDQFTARLDYTFNQRNTLGGTFFFANFPAFDPFPDSSLVSPTTLKKNDRNRTVSLRDTHAFSDTLINEARFGYFYLDNSRSLDEAFLADELTNAGVGIPNPATLFDSSDATRRLGNFSFRGNLDDFSFGAPNDIFNRRLQKTLTLADNVTYLRATQTFRFGVEAKRNAFDTNLPEEQGLQFERIDNFGQLLAGRATEADTQFGVTDKEFRFSDLSWYVTDDWKVSRKLTLNFGLRWDWFGWPMERNGRLANFDFDRVTNFDDIRPGFILPSNARLTNFNAIDRSIEEIARAENEHTLNGQDLNNFAPRFGFAYAPFASGQTVIRGGYGVFFDRPSAAFMNTLFSNYPFLREIESVLRQPTDGTITNAFSQQDPNLPFANYLPFRVRYLLNEQYGIFDSTPVTRLASGELNRIIDLETGTNVVGNQAETFEFRAIDRDLRTPYIQQWNLGIQQQFGSNWVVEARYVGTKGTKLLQAVGFNQPYDLNDPNTPDHIFRRLNDAYERAFRAVLAREPGRTPQGTLNGPLRQGVSERERGRGIAYGGANDALDGVLGNLVTRPNGEVVSGGRFDFNIADPFTRFNVIPIDARTPYLGFGNPEAILLQSAANSIYHSGQVSVTKRLSSGFQFNTSYTWSKAIDTISTDPGSTASAGRPDVPNAGLVVQGDQRNLKSNRAVADFDRPHRFAGNFVFDIPSFGSQSRFLTGWQLSGFAQVQSGSPFTIYSTEPEIVPTSDETGLAEQFLGTIRERRQGFDPVTGAPLTLVELTLANPTGGLYRLGFGRPTVRSLELLRQQGPDPTRQYFNTLQDPNNPQTALITAFGGFGNLGRNTLRGPKQKRMDLSLSKLTRFSERLELELKWDVFNVFNFVNFANPNTDLQDDTDFGEITRTVGGPRAMQFGVKVRF
ncbi:MAG: carboxypeptidase regulatory-like domain-containing protein [Pyrinomonadaceae bacterium]